MASIATTNLTAEDLSALPEDPNAWRFELEDGALQEVSPAGMSHTMIVGLIYKMLATYVESHQLGIVLVDGIGYILSRDPDTVRVPDVSYISRDRLPESGPPSSMLDIVPILAVEVVSPSNSAAELRRRTRDYLDAGVEQVWIVWPEDQSISVYAGSTTPVEYATDDSFDGGDVLPGFSIPVADLFDIDW